MGIVFLLPTLVFLVSLSAMLGWIFEVPFLIQIYPSFPIMVFNTALCFLLSALASLGSTKNNRLLWVSLIPVTLSILVLFQYFWELNLGIDEAFVKGIYNTGLSHPGRMAPVTAVCFILFNSGLILKQLLKKTSAEPLLSNSLSILVVLLALSSISGFVFNLHISYAWGSFAKMALHTSVCFLFLGFSLPLSNFLNSSNKFLSAHWISTFVTTFCLLLTMTLWQSFVESDATKVNQLSKANADLVTQQIIDGLDFRVKALERMVERRIQKYRDYTRQEWNHDIARHHSDFPGLMASGWSDQNGNMQWIFPLEIEQKYRHLSLVREPLRAETFARAKNSGKTQLTPMIEYPWGGHGFNAFIPFAIEGQFRGVLSSRFHLEKFLESLQLPKEYQIEVSDRTGTLFRENYDDPKIQNAEWKVSVEFPVPPLNWVISVTPLPATLRAQASRLTVTVFIVGVLISLLIGFCVMLDLEIRRSRRQVLRDLQWNNAILSGSDLAIIAVNPQGIVKSFNPKAEQLLGYKSEEVCNQMTPALWHDPQEVEAKAKELAEKYSSPVQGMEVFFFEAQLGIQKREEWSFLTKTGDRRQGTLSVHILHDHKKQISGYVGIIQDITENKLQASQIQRHQAILFQSSKMASLGEMASGIAHEINNPLSIINNKAQVIRSLVHKAPINLEKIDSEVDRIESTINRIAKIIQGLRSFARDSATDPFGEASVHHLIEETLSLCTERFKAHGVELRVISCPSDLYFEARTYQVSQVLLNLLNNAFDAAQSSPENSVKWVQLEIVDSERGIEFIVTDSGPGVPVAIQDKIMQPFFTTKEVGQGTGLGLSISQGIMAEHHGKLVLDSSSKVTCFSAWFPKQQSPKSSAA